MERLRVEEEILGAEHPDVAADLNNLAGLCWSMGEPAEAITFCERALEIRRKVPGEDHPDTARCLNRLAQLHCMMGEFSRAAPLLREALRVFRAHVETTFAVLPERSQLSLARSVRNMLDLLLTLPRELAGPPAEVYREVLATKGLVFTRQLLVRLAGRDPGHGKTFEEPEKRERARRERRLAVFLVRSDRAVERIDLGAMGPVRAAVGEWRRSLAGAQASDAGDSLRRRIWEPLEARLDGVKTVLVSPDGALNRLPLAALPGKDPGSFLLDRYLFAVVPVPRPPA